MTNKQLGPIVSSAHLADGKFPELSEFEFGLIMTFHAFQRWMVRGMTAAGCGDLSALDTLVLHSVNHRRRGKKLADICLVLNVEDTHTVTYSLKKLEKLKLIKALKTGKEKIVEITSQGQEVCRQYKEIREKLLEAPVKELGFDEEQIAKLALFLRGLSGQYDQAARSAASL